MIRTIYMMVAPPASGKTTFVSHLSTDSDGCKVISRDDIRARIMKKQEWSKPLERKVFAEFKSEIQAAIESGAHTIYIDATHTVTRRRKDVIDFLFSLPEYKKLEYKLEAVVIKASKEECIERNSKRKGRAKVPYNRMLNFIDGFQEPTFSEGFDRIIHIEGVKTDAGMDYYWHYMDSSANVD